MTEQSARRNEYFEGLRQRLRDQVGASVDWAHRIRIASERDGIPFDDEVFDLVLSNQVLEHVADLSLLFREIRRVLAPDGVSVHFFPSREVLFEPHVRLPCLHRFDDWERRRRFLWTWHRLGLPHKGSFSTREAYAEWWADYHIRFAHFRPAVEMLRTARECGLRASFQWTAQPYLEHFRRLFGILSPATRYGAPTRVPGVRSALHFLARYAGSTTLVLSPPSSPWDDAEA